MKCRQCSKQIPDGFADCPWCGATPPGTGNFAAAAKDRLGGDPIAATVGGQLAASEFEVRPPARFGLHQALALAGSVVCLATIAYLNYLATLRVLGPLAADSNRFSATFFGRTVGSYIIPAIGAIVYYKTRKKGPDGFSRFFAVSSWAVFWSLLMFALAKPGATQAYAEHEVAAPRDAPLKALAAVPVAKAPMTKWDPAIRSFYGDLSAQQKDYVAAISKLDGEAIPMFMLDSFRDAATIQQVLSRLQSRRAVADQFSSPESLLAKLPAYASQIDATEVERKSFVQDFGAATRKNLSNYKTVYQNEKEWLKTTTELYQYALRVKDSYAIENGKLRFSGNDVEQEFRRKFAVGELRKLRFLQSYRAFIAAENRLFAEEGLSASPVPPPSRVPAAAR